MPRTLGYYRRAPEPQSGFTLLELLLVLVLMGLATALVAPNLAGRLARTEQHAMIERTEDLLASLPARARAEQAAADWSAGKLLAALEKTTERTQLSVTDTLRYDSRGLAQGGVVWLSIDGRHLAAWRVERHLGTVRRIEQTDDAR